MYKVIIREMCGRERLIFEGFARTNKQVDYMYKSLAARHPEPIIAEYQKVGAFLEEALTIELEDFICEIPG